MDVDALVITLPARRSGPGDEFYLQAVQELVDSALAHRIPPHYFHQLNICLWRRARHGERNHPA